MRELTTAALAAKEVRKDLAQAFPGTKFSVKSENYSMGNSVSVHWTDRPTSEAVESIISKYQYGYFDGMTDCYEYNNKKEDLPQVKYVTCHRDMSDDTRTKIISDHNEKFCESGQIKDLNSYNEDAGCYNDQLVYRIFCKLDLTVKGVSA